MAKSKATPPAAFSRPIPSSGGTRALDAEPLNSGPTLGNLWQMPLLLVSLGLFTLAAYLFIDPQPGPTFKTQLARAQRDITAERYDAAVGELGDLLKLGNEAAQEAGVRLMLAEALDGQMRRNKRQETPQAHRRIINETTAAFAGGVEPTSAAIDRLGRSYEALGQIDDAATQYARATALLEKDGRPELATPMRRSTVEMLVANDRPIAATDALKAFLDVPKLADDERAWALGELARLSIDAGRPAEAMGLLKAALALSPDEAIKGQVNFRLGYAAWKLGESGEAERYLKLAREQFGSGHYLDAEANYLLGRIAQDRGDPAEADAYYAAVLRDDPGSRVAPKARLGSATCQILLGKDAAGVDLLGGLADEVMRRPSLSPLKEDLLSSLRQASRILAGRKQYELALDLLAREQAMLGGDVPAEFFARLGQYLEALSDQTAATLAGADEATRPTIDNRVRGLRTRAGDAFIAYSRKLTLVDDSAYGDAMWKGVELYEKATNLPQTVAALELFTGERPTDPITPDALYRLGRTYQALGRQDKATATFVDLRGRYPQTLAAAEAAVPLAQAYVASGDAKYPTAEGVLRSVTDDNPLLTPDSQTYRRAVWELANLYHRMGRYSEALARLEEYASRYPDNEKGPRLTFLRADCYRQAGRRKMLETSGGDPLKPEAQLAASADAKPAFAAASDAEARQYLAQAKTLFDQAINVYDAAKPAGDLDRVYEQSAYFYRADCAFDLGFYDEAIKLYDAAAFRYQDDPATLAAYVQIVNAYVATNRPEEAKRANERAKWLLKRIPPEAFTDGRFTLSRDRWQQWLAWSGEAGMW